MVNSRFRFLLFLIFILLSAPSLADSNLNVVKLDIKSVGSARAPYDRPSIATAQKDKSFLGQMYLAELQSKTSNFRDCTKTLDRLKKQTEPLNTWIIRKNLICELSLTEMGVDNQISLRSKTKDLIDKWSSAPDYLRQAMKQPIYSASLLALRGSNQISQVSFITDYFQENQSKYKDESIYNIFKRAGEIAEKQGDKDLALLHYLLAYKYKNDSKLLQNKISLLDPKILAEPDKLKDKPKEQAVSKSERSAYDKFYKQYKLGNYLSSIEKAVEYLLKYPEGQWSEGVSEKVSRTYRKMSAGRSDRLLLARQNAVEKMSNAPESYLMDWSMTMFYRERYEDIEGLLEDYINDKKDSNQVSAKLILQLALAKLHQAKFKNALDYFNMITANHLGSDSADEAFFRSGLVNYRLKKFDDAVKSFEAYLSRTQDGDFEVSSLYWMWRSYEKSNSEKAKEVYDTLVDRYPLSYFGLRAAVEVEESPRIIKSVPKLAVNSVSLALSKSGKASWSALQKLIKSSWLDEAEVEIKYLSDYATEANSQVFISHLYSKIYSFVESSKTMWPALRKNTKLNVKENIEIIFPQLFKEDIKAQAKRYGLSPKLIQGLIRQESSYLYRATSGAGARGLMQILFRTAQEIARDLRISSLKRSADLYDPETNIRIGTNYIYRLIKRFDGNTSLALASYNAGIGNVGAWLKNRQDLSPKAMTTNEVDSEIWMDELPWLETSGYVKNVLRNWVVYSLIEDPKTKVVFPIN